MYHFRLLVLLTGFLHVSYLVCGQDRHVPTVSEILSIIQKGELKKMVFLVDSLDYEVADSSVSASGSLSYISQEKYLAGPTIFGCWTNAKRQVQGISLTVRQKLVYEKLLVEMGKLGYKSIGKPSNGPGEGEMSQDYEKGKMLISVSVKKSIIGWSYEFTFIKM
jgi:hypothetical protein